MQLEQVAGNEPLARYLTQSNHLSPSLNCVRPKAFDPPLDMRLSVFRIHGFSIHAVWENGNTNVVDKMSPPRRLHGVAQIITSTVRGVGLDAVPDEPPPRHACIVKWPQDKSERILLSQKLAAQAQLLTIPSQ